MGRTSEIELILIAYTKVGDSSIVIHTLSREYGRKSFITSIGKSTSISSFLPLNILSCKITENPKSQLWRAKEIQPITPLSSLRSDLRKNAITLFLSEVLYRSLKDGSNEEGLYEWCKKMIYTLDSMQEDFSSFHLWFLLQYASILGFKADDESIAPFAEKHYEDLQKLLHLDFTSFMLYPLTGKERSEIAEILIHYLSYHLDIRLDIKSLSVLRELFGD